MTESQTESETDLENPKSFEVTLYRSGFNDIQIVLAAKNSTQACQKALKAYGSWNIVQVRNARATPAQPETLTMIQAAAAKLMFIALGELTKEAEDVLIEQITRAFNAGYQSHAEDVSAKAEAAADYERDQEVRRQEYAMGIEPVCGMAEEPEEVKQIRRQRRQDQADLIDLILHYKNPADEETRMRQIRVVMD